MKNQLLGSLPRQLADIVFYNIKYIRYLNGHQGADMLMTINASVWTISQRTPLIKNLALTSINLGAKMAHLWYFALKD